MRTLLISRRRACAGILALAGTPAVAQLLPEPSPRPQLDVPYVPTPQEVVERMLGMAQVSSADFVMDLGCGDGRMLIAAATRYGARGFGVDLNPQRIREAMENAKAAQVLDKVRFEVKNLFDTSIRDADVLTMYLLPNVNLQLRPRILDEMKPGARIVSHAFDMGDWEPDQRDIIDYSRIYFWVVPAKVAGRWALTDGAERLELTIDQTFQKLAGAARGSASSGRLEGRLKGAEIELSVDLGGRTRRYAGRVEGGAVVPAPGTTWSLARL